MRGHGRLTEEQRAVGDQQAHAVLHRIDVGDEIVGDHEVDHVDQVVNGGPRGEGQPRRTDLDALGSKGDHRVGRVRRGVAFVETAEDEVADRLERGDHERAAGFG